ncbi:MAG: MurT ligase domain-containing protein [Dermatophilus congolensis]|nr:MurT ligase domain-containing protein [Dermatophilus congolensis]
MLRTTAAVIAGKATRVASRLRGGGSALPGLVAERMDPAFLRHALADVHGGIVVVSGTNGKTTTTKMLVAIMRAHGHTVFSNPTGSNFTRGVISAMLEALPLTGRLDADYAILELDEAHSLRFADAVRPTHALLLNVARDQLDRFAEIDYTAKLLGQLASRTTSGVVLNRDDSYIARIAAEQGVPEATWFGLDASVADRLTELQEADLRDDVDAVEVPEPGERDALLRPVDDRRFAIDFTGANTVGPLELRQRGLAAMINATAATAMARRLLGNTFDEGTTAAALAQVAPPFGRGEVIDAGGAPLELVLVKNPAGFTVALSTYGATPVPTMIAINDNTADGRDVSWLYDVSFESLRERGVYVTSGLRAYDMALRLRYDDVDVENVEPDLEEALEAFLAAHPGQPLRLFCTYTAMMQLRKRLAAKYGLADFGEDEA